MGQAMVALGWEQDEATAMAVNWGREMAVMHEMGFQLSVPGFGGRSLIHKAPSPHP